MQILGRADSSNVQAVMWGAAELGLAPERLDYGHRFGGTDTEEFASLNPNRKVPVLRDGEVTLFESCAILRYLAARYGDGGAFWPAGPVERARVDQWAEWAKVEFALGFTQPIFWARVRTAAADRDEATLAHAEAAHLRRCEIAEIQLERGGPHICGEFSLADVVLGHLLYRHDEMGLPMGPSLRAYYGRLTERAPFRDHVMVSYEALRHPEA